MKLLFDQNLSPKLVHRLADLFPDSSHVQLVGLDRAGDDLDQRRFAGPIFSNESVYFPRAELKRNAFQRPDAGEGLADIYQSQEWDFGHHLRRSSASAVSAPAGLSSMKVRKDAIAGETHLARVLYRKACSKRN